MRIQISVPPNTPIETPLVTRLLYNNKVMNRQAVEIPDGHAYLTGVQLLAGRVLLRVLPEPDSNAEWLTGNNRVVEKRIKLNYDLPSFQIEVRAYNLDDTYQHSFYIDLEE